MRKLKLRCEQAYQHSPVSIGMGSVPSGQEKRMFQPLGWCKHFPRRLHHLDPDSPDLCQKGVRYSQFLDPPSQLPCFQRDASAHRCVHVEYNIPEEDSEIERRNQQLVAMCGSTRQEIVRRTAGRHGVEGKMPCLFCSGEVKYLVSDINGHIHARCTTLECVTWKE